MFNKGKLSIFTIGSGSGPGEHCEGIGFANVFEIIFLFLVQNYHLCVVFNEIGGKRLHRTGAGVGNWRVSFSCNNTVEVTVGFLKTGEKSAYYHPSSVICVAQRCRSCQVLNACNGSGAVGDCSSAQELQV